MHGRADAGRRRSRRPASRPRRSCRPSRSTAASASPAASTSTTTNCRAAADGRPLNERPGADTVSRALPGCRRIGDERFFLVGAPLRTARAVRHARASGESRPGALRRRRRDRRSRAGPAARGARRPRPPPRWWSAPPITARPSASTARSATAFSSTTRRCGCRWSCAAPACRAARRGRATCRWSTSRRRSPRWRARRLRARRRVADAGAGAGAHRCHAPALRRVVRAAARFRVGGPPDRARRAVEVHRRAEARAVRHRARPRRVGQPDLASSPTRSAAWTAEADRVGGAPAEPRRSPRAGAGRRGAASLAWLSSAARGAPERGTATGSQGPHRAGVAAGHGHLRRGARRRADRRPSRPSSRDDPANPQAHLRLGYAEIERGRCAAGRAAPASRARRRHAVRRRRPWPGRLPRAAPAICRRPRGAAGSRAAAEPGNPVVAANLGSWRWRRDAVGRPSPSCEPPWQPIPICCEARFALARALAATGDRAGAAAEAATLLGQLPPDAPQRAEVSGYSTRSVEVGGHRLAIHLGRTPSICVI